MKFSQWLRQAPATKQNWKANPLLVVTQCARYSGGREAAVRRAKRTNNLIAAKNLISHKDGRISWCRNQEVFATWNKLFLTVNHDAHCRPVKWATVRAFP